MALTNIVDKILSDANSEANEILAKSKEDANLILNEAKDKGAKIKEEILSKARQEASKRVKSADISYDLQLKNALLQEKQNMLDEVFESAKKALIELDDDKYQEFARKVLVGVIAKGDEEIIFSLHDKDRIDSKFISSVNKELVKLGREGKLTIAFDKKVDSGFIVKAQRVQIDCTLDTIVKMIRDEVQEELIKILFK